MFQSLRMAAVERLESVRGEWSRRAVGFLVALVLEAFLIALLLSLGREGLKNAQPDLTVVDLKANAPAEETPPDQPEPETPPAANADQPRPVPQPQVSPRALEPQPRPAVVMPPPAAILPTTAPPPAPSPPATTPPAPAKPKAVIREEAMGPAFSGSSGDTARVGTAPNGEPMYAAAWYRKPTDDELAGYMSTADGPGWGLIACRTAPDFRVEDCVALDEYPEGSKINRAVLAAAWQFRVRPPRKGGQVLVGSWVRIRIDYTLRIVKQG